MTNLYYNRISLGFMQRMFLIAIIGVALSSFCLAQEAGKLIRQGNTKFKSGQFDAAEIDYRKALTSDSTSVPANFNTGAALYKQGKYDESMRQFESLAGKNLKPSQAVQNYRALGNSLFQQKKYAESISAYKNALLTDPSDEQSRHNLAVAMQYQKQQQQQQQQQQQGGDNKDKKDKDKKEEPKNDKQKKDDESSNPNNDEKKKPQPQDGMSKDDARRMLEAVQNEEQKTQEKLKKQQAAAQRIPVEKNW